MATIILPHRMMVQPQTMGQLDPSHPLLAGATMIAVPSFGRTWTRNNLPAGTGIHNDFVVSGSALIGGRARGMAFVSTALSGKYFLVLSNSGQVFTSTTECTVFMLRRHTDTTLRAATSFGFSISTSNRILLSAPFSDGNAYWDFGSTDGTHRISAAWGSKDTNVHSLVLVAGSVRGREIWRNGLKLAGDPSINAATSVGFLADIAVGGDLEENYLVGVVARVVGFRDCRVVCEPLGHLHSTPALVAAWRRGAGTSSRCKAAGVRLHLIKAGLIAQGRAAEILAL